MAVFPGVLADLPAEAWPHLATIKRGTTDATSDDEESGGYDVASGMSALTCMIWPVGSGSVSGLLVEASTSHLCALKGYYPAARKGQRLTDNLGQQFEIIKPEHYGDTVTVLQLMRETSPT